MTKQLALLRLHPGKFAGFGTACSFVSANPAEDIEYFCPPTIVLQRETRLCRHDLIWASGHTTDVWTVAHVEGNKVELLATCQNGYASGPNCPNGHGDAVNGWTRTPGTETPASKTLSTAIPKLDPDGSELPLDDIMKACLYDKIFPGQDAFLVERRP